MLTTSFIRTNKSERKSPFNSPKSYYVGGIAPIRPYFRSSGTLVKPHLRTKPDGTKVNNFSFWK